MMKTLSKKVDTIFIAGNNVNYLNKYKELFKNMENNKACLKFAMDGMGNITPMINQYIQILILKKDMLWFDIGNISLNTLIEECNKADIIFWNGTLGIVENEYYKLGSEIIYYLKELQNKKIIIGGGDTAGFVNKHNNNKNFYHISTGGGASIDYIANGKLFCEM